MFLYRLLKFDTLLTRIILSSLLLLSALLLEHFTNLFSLNGLLRVLFYIAAFAFVGLQVIWEGVRSALSGDFFTEFTLMSLACIGAFLIGEYPEAVAVMLLYAIGEYFQDKAVDKARNNIKALINIRPKIARVVVDERESNVSDNKRHTYKIIDPMKVAVGEVIEVRRGERVCVDGISLQSALYDTSALTGESAPRSINVGEEVLSGMILLSQSVYIKAIREAKDSEVERMLCLVEHAAEKKSHTEIFIRKFARVYTPIMMALALLVIILPWLYSLVSGYITEDLFVYNFSFWFYRALMLLVVSCPCALVISVPLSYYSGIGVGSRCGILFKGGIHIDTLSKVRTILFDKTGTLTTPCNNFTSHNNHPPLNNSHCPNPVTDEIPQFEESLKADAKETILSLKKLGIEDIIILSGDRREKVAAIANQIEIEKYFAELLPEGKIEWLNRFVQEGKTCAFVGDGINDAPALRSASVGIAMGALGSEAAVESADIVLQTDQLNRVVVAIKVALKTKTVVKENIVAALAIKAIMVVLGFCGVASLWGAVFADSGMALLTVANSLRIMFFRENKH